MIFTWTAVSGGGKRLKVDGRSVDIVIIYRPRPKQWRVYRRSMKDVLTTSGIKLFFSNKLLSTGSPDQEQAKDIAIAIWRMKV